jgi:azurin
MQHHLRDPNRDHEHGRIYRMTYEGKTVAPVKIAGQPVPALLELLKEPENDTRNLAKIELAKHDTTEVMGAVDKWVAGLDKADKNYEHNRLEGLWVRQWNDVVNVDLLKAVLKSPEPNARAAATRVLCYWRDRVPEAVALLKEQANDESPRVRLEAVRALSFFNGPAAKEAMLASTEVLSKPMDYWLDYTFKETMKQLQTLVKDAVLPTNPRALDYTLGHMTDAELLKSPATEATLHARLERPSIDINQRLAAIKSLGAMHKTTAEAEFPNVLKYLDGKEGKGSAAAADLSKGFGAMVTTELAKSVGEYAALAEKAATPGVRQTAAALMIIIDADPTRSWSRAMSDTAKESTMQGLALVTDASLREQFQPLLAKAVTDPTATPAARAAALQALPLMGAVNAKANFALIAAALQKDDTRATAARAIMQLPRDSWDKAAAGAVVKNILAWAKTVPNDKRTEQSYVETTQTGMELAGLLGTEGAALRKELRGLGVSVYVIKTVREQMRYDTTRLVVEAGKPFEVIMENTDFMPHNIVFVQPGSRLEIAKEVSTQKPDKLDKQGRAYFPDPKKEKRVIDGTPLVEGGKKATLKMTAPKKEGDYEYVCTFPEHGQNMYGTLVVTKDVDAYLAAHPMAAAQPSGTMDHSAHKH